MIGAIIGDIAGSTYEFHSIKTMDFPLFAPGSSYTDDSLMSIAVASALMQTGESHDGFKSHAVTSIASSWIADTCTFYYKRRASLQRTQASQDAAPVQYG